MKLDQVKFFLLKHPLTRRYSRSGSEAAAAHTLGVRSRSVVAAAENRLVESGFSMLGLAHLDGTVIRARAKAAGARKKRPPAAADNARRR